VSNATNLTTNQSGTMKFSILIETTIRILDLGSEMRILLAEDEEVSAAVLCGKLTSMGHDVTIATDGLIAWRLLQKEHFPVVISDWMMPGLDGPSLCRRIRAAGDSPYTYIILVSVRDRYADRMEGLRAGADDFLTKPFEAEELAVRLEIARRILTIQQQLERQNARLTELATTDDLTGLANRREFRRAIEANFALARGQGPSLSLILLDIDHFKDFNDTFGHPAGDAALRTLAQALRATCREHELAARFGGEEFAVVLLGASRDEARASAERIRAALRESPWAHRPLTASFGIATSGLSKVSIAELVEQADAALYFSKQRGRDRITHHDEMPVGLSAAQPSRGEFLGSTPS
jgi:diguanylate cyclase (GGDEF)-like protein